MSYSSRLGKAAKILVLAVFTVALPVAASAQFFNKTYDYQTSERAQSIRYTTSGNIIAAGYLQNVVGRQTLAMKTSGSGVLQWSKNLIPSTWGYDYPLYPADVFYAVREMPWGGFVAVGYTNQNSSVPWVLANENVLVVRFDTNGNIGWRTTYGGLANDRGYNIEVLEGGDMIITGIMDDSTGLSATSTPKNGKLFIMKIDALGQLTWCTKVGETTSDPYGDEHYAGYAVQKLSDGSFISVGTCSNPTYLWQRSVYAVRVSSTGTLLWANAYTNPNEDIHMDQARGVRQMPDGGIVISGSANNFSGTATYDMFLMKITPTVGQVLWTKRYYTEQLGTSYNNFGYELHRLNSGDFVLAGVTAYGSAASLTRFSSTGTLSWSKYYPNLSSSSETSAMDVIEGQGRNSGFLLATDPAAFHLVRTDMNGLTDCYEVLPLEEEEVEFVDTQWGEEFLGCQYAYTVATSYDYYVDTTTCSELEKSGSNIAPETGTAVVSLSPNPAEYGAIAGLNFMLPNEAKVQVQFTDLLGIELFASTSVYGAGQHRIALPTQQLQPGVYIANITIDGVRTTQKLVIIR